MGREPWYESDNPDRVVRGAGLRIALWVLAGVALTALGAVLVFAFQTGTAEPRGRGEAYQQKESANNRIFAQQRFEDLSAEIEATKVKISAAAPVRRTSPEAEVRYQGLVQHCASTVAQYNAAARSYTQQDFRAADLPPSYNSAIECADTLVTAQPGGTP